MNDVHGIGSGVMGRRGESRAKVVAALGALVEGTRPSIAWSELADEFAASYQAIEGDAAWAFGQSLRSLGQALQWEPALESADPRPERFRDAARHLASKVLDVERRGAWPKPLEEALQLLAQLDGFADIARVVDLLQRTPIPGRVSTLLEAPRGWTRSPNPVEPEQTPTVLLKFTLDGQPVSWPMSLNPARAYQLEAIASVDAWPKDATQMDIELSTDVPVSVIECPSISISAGETSGRGYLVPKVEIGRSAPVTLTPRVSFLRSDRRESPANVVGQRSLRVSTFDPIEVGLGQPMVAQRIVELLSELDGRIKNLPRQDRLDLIHLLEATARFQALANGRPDLRGIDEGIFQGKLKQAFVQDRFIGTRIQEAPKLAAGTTDLLLGRIVDELKVSHDPIDIDDADKFVRQPTQYASAGDCPVSILTVLDDSPKSDPEGVMSNYMRWAIPKLHGLSKPRVPSMVVVVVIRIGFPVPSAFSKMPTGEIEHLSSPGD
ncbi:MAG: hypothetical protein ABSE70_05030 [Candidatus Limnocylindrales bacterium]